MLQASPNTSLSNAGQVNVLCDSPDSGVVSGNDTKSTISNSDNEDDCVIATVNSLPVDSDHEEEEACLEYPKRAKRRRIF